MSLRIRLLGPAEIRRDDELIQLRGQKPLALLTYLLLTGEAQMRPHLADLLYDESDDPRASLRWTLHHLRHGIGKAYTLSDRQQIAFNFDADHWLDVRAFEAGQLDLYQGELLEGLHLRDAQYFMEWLFFERERLRDVREQVLAKKLATAERQGDHPLAASLAQQLLCMNNLREEWTQALMRAYAHQGKRGAALAQYERCQKLLYEELGIAPSPQTRALYEQICHGGTGSGSCATSGAAGEEETSLQISPTLSRRPSAHRHNLPPPPTPLVGRQHELARLDRLLLDPEARLITVLGPGGIGKTRLALAAAARRLAEPASPFADGIFFVDLTPLRAVQQIVPTVGECLGLSFESTEKSMWQQLLDHLRQRQLLLLLDNFEHLLAGTGLLLDILKHAPEVTLLVTSRERLCLCQEQAFPLDGLPYPVQETEADATHYAAVRLFLQSARRVQPDYAPGQVERLAVNRICRLVEGLPLAVELAASWSDVLATAEIAAEIEQGLDILQTDRQDMPPRHHSIRAVFNSSWQQLEPPAQAVFARLSIFRGGATREAARQVAGATLPLLTRLVRKSLLRFHQNQERYSLHELLRQYGTEKLARMPETETAVRDDHSRYYCDWLHKRETVLDGVWKPAALLKTEADIENVRAAWERAIERQQWSQVAEVLDGMNSFYDWRRRYEEGADACHKAINALSAAGGRPHLLARVQTWLARFLWQSGNRETAARLLQQTLPHLDRLAEEGWDTRKAEADARLLLADVFYDKDRPAVHRLLERSLSLYRTLDDRRGMAKALDVLGRATMAAGNSARARLLCQESVALRRQIGDLQGLPWLLETLSLIALSRGEFDTAEAQARESLVVRREIGDCDGIAYGLHSLGWSLYVRGDFVGARAQLEETLAAYRTIGSRYGIASATALLTMVLVHLGCTKEVRSQAELAQTRSRRIGKLWGLGFVHFSLGCAALAEGDIERAGESLQQAASTFSKIGQQDELAQVLAVQGYVARLAGRRGEATQFLQRSLYMAGESQAFLPLMPALPLAALLLADRGCLQPALMLHALTSGYAYVANSRWFTAVVGHEMKELTASLPAAAAESACRQGRALDLWVTADRLRADGLHISLNGG